MHAEIRRIGNSRGVILPKALLEQCHLEREIDLQVVDGILTIQAVSQKRSGWAEAFEAARATEDSEQTEWQSFPNDFDDSEWVW